MGQYKGRIFTRSIVGWPGVEHITGDDFSAAIECALSQPGFAHTEIEHLITVGFGRNALMNAAPAVIEQVKAGNIRHFFWLADVTAAGQSAATIPNLLHQHLMTLSS